MGFDDTYQYEKPIKEKYTEHRRKAVRALASEAVDADELRRFLDMLGLDPDEGKSKV